VISLTHWKTRNPARAFRRKNLGGRAPEPIASGGYGVAPVIWTW
jgi:hypothetical protein